MKKIIAVGAFAVLGVVALSSCKKDYKCTYANGGGEVTYTGLTKAQAATAEASCNTIGGTWSKN